MAKYWAFERVWGCIMQLTDDQFTQHIEYSAGSVRNHIIHMMSATRRWIKRLEGAEVPPHLSFGDYTTRKATKAKWDEIRAEVMEYICTLTQAQLDEIIQWELPSRGVKHENRRWEVLLHVANHTTDHRSQMLAMINQTFGIETVEQDMIFYLVESK